MTPKKHWLRPPKVSAPSGADRNRAVNYKVSEHYLDCLGAVFRQTPVFQTWVHVIGELPPINNISRVMRGGTGPTLTTLHDSVACFRGVNRPYDDEALGESVLVYVINPRVSLDYVADLVCAAKTVQVPGNTCLTVQVKPFKTPLQQDGLLVEGVVTRLEFVTGTGTGDKPTLPEDCEGRYIERLW